MSHAARPLTAAFPSLQLLLPLLLVACAAAANPRALPDSVSLPLHVLPAAAARSSRASRRVRPDYPESFSFASHSPVVPSLDADTGIDTDTDSDSDYEYAYAHAEPSSSSSSSSALSFPAEAAATGRASQSRALSRRSKRLRRSAADAAVRGGDDGAAQSASQSQSQNAGSSSPPPAAALAATQCKTLCLRAFVLQVRAAPLRSAPLRSSHRLALHCYVLYTPPLPPSASAALASAFPSLMSSHCCRSPMCSRRDTGDMSNGKRSEEVL